MPTSGAPLSCPIHRELCDGWDTTTPLRVAPPPGRPVRWPVQGWESSLKHSLDRCFGIGAGSSCSCSKLWNEVFRAPTRFARSALRIACHIRPEYCAQARLRASPLAARGGRGGNRPIGLEDGRGQAGALACRQSNGCASALRRGLRRRRREPHGGRSRLLSQGRRGQSAIL
jgi:hypothetical protein